MNRQQNPINAHSCIWRILFHLSKQHKKLLLLLQHIQPQMPPTDSHHHRAKMQIKNDIKQWGISGTFNEQRQSKSAARNGWKEDVKMRHSVKMQPAHTPHRKNVERHHDSHQSLTHQTRPIPWMSNHPSTEREYPPKNACCEDI